MLPVYTPSDYPAITHWAHSAIALHRKVIFNHSPQDELSFLNYCFPTDRLHRTRATYSLCHTSVEHSINSKQVKKITLFQQGGSMLCQPHQNFTIRALWQLTPTAWHQLWDLTDTASCFSDHIFKLHFQLSKKHSLCDSSTRILQAAPFTFWEIN